MYRNKIRYDVATLVPKDAKSVLEIGAGAGMNYVIYPKDSYKVAIEPEERTDAQTIDKVPGASTNTIMDFMSNIPKTASLTWWSCAMSWNM